jgi:hypothetical protein
MGSGDWILVGVVLYGEYSSNVPQVLWWMQQAQNATGQRFLMKESLK